MLNVSRRGLLGMFAAGAAAAIVRPSLIMPIKPALVPQPGLTLVNNSSGRMVLQTDGGVFPIDTSKPDLLGEMAAALVEAPFQAFGFGGMRNVRFRGDPDATHRFDREVMALATAGKSWAWEHPQQPGAIVRMFRGVPLEHMPVETHGLPGLAVPDRRVRVRVIGTFENRNVLA